MQGFLFLGNGRFWPKYVVRTPGSHRLAILAARVPQVVQS
jgi:hypothetical protein